MKQRVFTTVVVSSLAASALGGQSPVQKSTLHDYRVVRVAEGLINPWSLAFLPNGDVLVTERPGRLRIIRQGRLLPNPVEGVPTVHAVGQGGLLDVVLHPNFASNQLVYFSYSKPLGDSTATTAVARGKWENDRLTNVQDIWVSTTRGNPRSGHYGSRIAFDKNGFLFVSVGDRQVPPAGDLPAHPAQDFSNNHGSINRLHDDGRIPNDNPFVGRDNMKPELWSKGHRNPQGLAVDPATGEVWATEHGPQGGDELNLISKGKNYGWPVIGFGVNYTTGAAIHSGTHKEGMEQPKHVWVPSIGTSGLMFYTGDKFPGWKGSLFAGGLVGEQLVRLTLDSQRVEVADVLMRRQGRIRDVKQSPDGFIYLAIDHRQGQPTPILRLEPVGRN